MQKSVISRDTVGYRISYKAVSLLSFKHHSVRKVTFTAMENAVILNDFVIFIFDYREI